MRRIVILSAILTAVSLVAINHTSACGWRVPRHGAGAGRCDYHHPAAVTQATQASAQTATARVDHRSLDERKCAELGPEWCRMITRMHDADPYPVCKVWKWDPEEGWGWDWSEFNCPWRQCHDDWD